MEHEVRAQRYETVVFLLLIVPSLILSFFVSRRPATPFELLAVSTIFRDIALVGLIVFFLWRDRESLSAIGWNLKRAGEDVFLGIGLFMPVFIGAGLLEALLRRAGFSYPGDPLPSFMIETPLQVGLAVLLFVVVALAEETIFRGYLLLRFAAWTNSRMAGVLLSTLIFALGHGYEGTSGVATVGVMGVVYAGVYLWRGSLTAPVVMHFLHNITSLLFVLSQKH